ncbi:hypothetical protein UNDKW_0153 [Undibacterium sp. KW1]|nr:hypothetical protein UNDKW_0153 [Undibacterium sp. KW1]
MRNELSEITGIRDQDHERYKYHITLGYIHRYLSATEAEQLQKLTKDCMQKVAELRRNIQIPSVEFCRFNDMFAFEVLHRL